MTEDEKSEFLGRIADAMERACSEAPVCACCGKEPAMRDRRFVFVEGSLLCYCEGCEDDLGRAISELRG